jgi:hypothetical protein
MTARKSFKRLVRTRMEKTGESYTTARSALLTADEPEAAERPWLATSDETIRERSGRGWEEWFDLLDEWGAADRTHRDIARWLADQMGIDPLAWNAQAITMSYERVRGLRAPGEHADGFTITASKTVAVPVERLYDAVVDAGERARWLPDAELRERTATRPRSARFDWGADGSRLVVTFAGKDAGRSTVSFSHERLAGADERDRMKAYWRERVTALKTLLEA